MDKFNEVLCEFLIRSYVDPDDRDLFRKALYKGKLEYPYDTEAYGDLHLEYKPEKILMMLLQGKTSRDQLIALGEISSPIPGEIQVSKNKEKLWFNDVRGKCRLRIQGIPPKDMERVKMHIIQVEGCIDIRFV